MEYKELEKLKAWRVPMALQLFAEGDGAGADGDGSGTGDDGDGKSGGTTKTFDEILAEESYQSEFDRRVQKAITTAVTNEQSKWQALTDDKLTEAEKLAKMTKEEKAEYRAKKLEKEIADLKRQNVLSDMSKTARKMLADEEITLPDELLGRLVAEDAENTKVAVDSFAKLFKAAVQDAVKDALKGKTPKAGASGTKLTREQILAISNTAERKKMIAENIELFQ